MFQTLRARLLLSYILLLFSMLLLIGFALIVYVGTRPIPTDDIVNELTATLLDVRVIDRMQVEIGGMGEGGMMSQGGMSGSVTITIEPRARDFLVEEATLREVRALLVTNSGRVLFDSAERYQAGDDLRELERTALMAATPMRRTLTLFKGRFADPAGEPWVYVSQPVRPLAELRPETVLLVLAQQVPRQTLREALRSFRESLFRPLARAGLVGLAIAVLLAVLISGSVARPLQRISQAAQRVASGHYRQSVPVEGPEEVRTLAQTFNRMTARVAAAQQAQADFLANVSHDLRTPLTSIQGFSQAIVEGVVADPASAQRAAQVIHDEAARLHRMVESLLDLARIEGGKLDMRQGAVALSDLLQGVGASLSYKAGQKGVALELQVPPDLPRLSGDGDRLAQVFTNLIDNAIKHTPAGGRILLSARAQPQGIAVTVQDSGTGIPAADLPRIFERFYQVDKSRESGQHSGVGLGLAIARQIVEAHGGTIQVASKMGEGTIFTVWLPFAGPDPSSVGMRP